ncbi:MAG: hypothetical protein ACK5TO_03155, partial [Planctomycetaceae bacterium]
QEAERLEAEQAAHKAAGTLPPRSPARTPGGKAAVIEERETGELEPSSTAVSEAAAAPTPESESVVEESSQEGGTAASH